MPFPGTQSLALAFDGGLQSKIAKFTLDQPNLEDAVNARYLVQGQIQPRTGFSALSTNIMGGGNISNGAAITTFNGELLVLDGETLYSWNPDQGVWVSKGTAFSAIAGEQRVINTQIATQSNPDASTIDNMTLYVWEDNRAFPAASQGIRYSIIDNTTGTFIVQDQLLYAFGSRPKVTSFIGPGWAIVYVISDTQFLQTLILANRPDAIYITRRIAGLPSDNALPFVPGTQQIPYDAPIGGIVYASTAGLWLLWGGSAPVNSTLTVQTVAMCTEGLYPAATNAWVAWSDATGTHVQRFNIALTPYFAPITLQTAPSVNIAVIEGIDPGSCNITCEVSNGGFGPDNPNSLNNYTVTSTGVATYVGMQRSAGLASKPFRSGGNLFVNVVYPSALQATYFTLCLTDPIGSGANPVTRVIGATSFTVVAKHAPSNGGGLRNNSLLSQCDPFEDGSFLFAAQRKGPFTSFQNAQTVNLGVSGYSTGFADDNAFNSVQSNNNLHIVGGVKKIYDGISVVEDNFHVFPEVIGPAPNGGNSCIVALTSGGNLSAGQYQYKVIYKWTDNYGQVQRSGDGVAVTVTATAGQAANIVVPTLCLTDKQNPRSPVSIAILRTQANLPIFYQITNDNAPLINNTALDAVGFLDTLSDADIAANENDYTGSQLSNTGPPACSLIAAYQQRLFINSDEDPNVLWYSQNKFDLSQYNTLPLDWNTSFVQGVDSRGGAITAIGLLDAQLAIFKETSIFLLAGDGPNPLDTSGQFNDAQLLVSDVGCTNPNSLVFCTGSPGGLLFKSAKGIYLLGRDTSVTYIGAPVEEYNGLEITSANLLAQTNEVAFTTAEGTCLVYNYLFGAWTTWAGLPAVDATVWEDQLVLLREDGSCQVQDTTGTVWEDSTYGGVVTPVAMKVTTPWLKLNGNLQGYMACYSATILGQFESPCLMQVDVAYDYDPSIVESAIVNSSIAGNRWGGLPVWGFPAGTWANRQFANLQFQLNFKNPRCQAIQLALTALNPQAGPCYTLNGINLEVLSLPGGVRMPTSNLIRTSGYSK
jgi:hypothetical protein